jgi:microcin C transport system permease protein
MSWMNRFTPLTRRRLKVFFRQGRARLGLVTLGFTLFFSFTAELWSHQNPLLFSREGKLYFPIFDNTAAAEFGITDSFVVDYRKLLNDDREKGVKSWGIFPLSAWDPYIQGPDPLQGPSSVHWLGTDNLGRDVFARLLYGMRVSLLYGLLFWLGAFAIGILIGSIQGYFVGTVDFVTERLKELAEIVPFLSVVILVNGLAKSQGFWVTLGVVILFAWISISSQMRAQFLSLRKRDFCEAARAMGAGHRRIIFRHILPNAITPIITLTPFTISAGISTLTILDYLGFGLNPPTPSLGELLAQGRIYIMNAPWLLLAPTASLIVMLIAINLIGESLRQAFDPRKS